MNKATTAPYVREAEAPPAPGMTEAGKALVQAARRVVNDHAPSTTNKIHAFVPLSAIGELAAALNALDSAGEPDPRTPLMRRLDGLGAELGDRFGGLEVA